MPRQGNQLGTAVPGTTYPCHPGGPNDYVYIYVQQQMWPAFVEVIGRPEWQDDARFRTPEARWEHREELHALVTAWTQQHSKYEVMRLLGAAGVPCGACQDTGELLVDPHLRAREMIVDLDYPVRGRYQTVGCPVKLSKSPARVTRPPQLGEHTEDVLRELCDIDPADLQRLRQDGVV